jgi:hypothetical protein
MSPSLPRSLPPSRSFDPSLSLQELIYDFVDVDGRGAAFPSQILNPSTATHSTSNLIALDHSTPLRVVEIRKLSSDYRVKGALAVVYGVCSASVRHQRFVCVDLYELRQDLSDLSQGPLLSATLLSEQVQFCLLQLMVMLC